AGAGAGHAADRDVVPELLLLAGPRPDADRLVLARRDDLRLGRVVADGDAGDRAAVTPQRPVLVHLERRLDDHRHAALQPLLETGRGEALGPQPLRAADLEDRFALPDAFAGGPVERLQPAADVRPDVIHVQQHRRL